jgi:hypothetical protein
MRRAFLYLIVVVIQTTIFAGAALAQDVAGFSDGFTYFDAARWSEGDHNLGRSYLDPTNVDVDGQNIRMLVSMKSFSMPSRRSLTVLS